MGLVSRLTLARGCIVCHCPALLAAPRERLPCFFDTLERDGSGRAQFLREQRHGELLEHPAERLERGRNAACPPFRLRPLAIAFPPLRNLSRVAQVALGILR